MDRRSITKNRRDPLKLTMVLIRAGMTRSGREGRQLGTVDEPLLDQERGRLRERAAAAFTPKRTSLM